MNRRALALATLVVSGLVFTACERRDSRSTARTSAPAVSAREPERAEAVPADAAADAEAATPLWDGGPARIDDIPGAVARACSRGDGKACTSLGDELAAGPKPPEDNVRALGFYRLGCDNRDADACRCVGVAYEAGPHVAKNAATALSFYERACKIAGGGDCTRVATTYENTLGDKARAAPFYRRACQTGEAFSCAALGRLHELGEGAEKDARKARALDRKACDANDSDGCYQLGKMSETSEPLVAANLYQRACEGTSHEACLALGALYAQGNGVRIDKQRAADAYHRACIKGFPQGCERACALGRHDDCG